MKKPAHLLPILLLVLFAVGCGSVEQRLKVANDLVGSTYTAIADARDAELVTQAELEPYRPIQESIDQLLDDAGERVRAHKAATDEQVRDQKEAEADSLIAEVRRLVLVELRPVLNLIETIRAGKVRSPAQPRSPPWTQ